MSKKELTIEEKKGSINEIWVELGRDPLKLSLDKKTEEQLDDGLEKLKAIRMGFGLLFKEDGNHKLAIHLLAKVFLGEYDEENV